MSNDSARDAVPQRDRADNGASPQSGCFPPVGWRDASAHFASERRASRPRMSRSVPPADPWEATNRREMRGFLGPQCTRSGCAHWKACSGGGLRTAGRGVVGPCALEGPFRRGYAQCGPRPVYKPPSKHGPQCAQPATSESRVCTVPFERGPQCTHPGRAHWRDGCTLNSYRGMRNLPNSRSWAASVRCAAPLGNAAPVPRAASLIMMR